MGGGSGAISSSAGVSSVGGSTGVEGGAAGTNNGAQSSNESMLAGGGGTNSPGGRSAYGGEAGEGGTPTDNTNEDGARENQTGKLWKEISIDRSNGLWTFQNYLGNQFCIRSSSSHLFET